jgi:hypothetical protein
MKIEKVWTTNEGFKAAVLFIDESHRCGYVGFNDDHWVHGAKYDYFVWVVDVHGGLTFAGDGGLTFTGEISELSDTVWWLGFDCAHSGDKTRWNEGIERTLDFCIEECEKLSAQIKTLSDTSFEHLVIFKKTGQKLPTNIHNKMIALSLVGDPYAIEYCKMLK